MARVKILVWYIAKCRGVRTHRGTSWLFSSLLRNDSLQNSQFSIFRMQRLTFPEGSAYRSETGGLMQALRKLTVEQSMYAALLSILF